MKTKHLLRSLLMVCFAWMAMGAAGQIKNILDYQSTSSDTEYTIDSPEG